MVSLGGSYTDGDVGDTHTATVDWGDGSSPQTVDAFDQHARRHPRLPRRQRRSPVHRQADRLRPDRSLRRRDDAGAGGQRHTGGRCRPRSDQRVDDRVDDSTFTDAGTGDSHTATVDWGDGAGAEPAVVTGSGGTGSIQAGHTYGTFGSRTVEVCVTDDEAASACDTFALDVAASPITVTAEPAFSIDEGGTVTVPFSFADGDGGTHTAIVHWSDGSTPDTTTIVDNGTSGSGSVSHTFPDDGVYHPSIEVCDTSNCGSTSPTVTVANVAPAVAAPTGVVADSTLAVTSTFTDPGVLDTHTATVDWATGRDPVPPPSTPPPVR